MSLLDKINNVTVNNTNRISEIDRKYCENQYSQYSKAQEALGHAFSIIKKVYEQQINEEESFLCKYDDIRHMEERISRIKRRFILNITSHFSRQYNVTLDSESIDEKYDSDLTHENIISEIFEQLGGYSFEEKAVTEIIEATRNTIYNFDKKVIIKKASLSIADYVRWDLWSFSGFRISWDSKLGTFFQALSHFENGSVETLYLLKSMIEHLKKGSNHYDIFSKYEFKVFNKIKSIKVFKNGKITIEFSSNEQANEFANTYLKK
ncbi:hypothetical protein P8881_19435 [Bacillus haynesii]|uniref:hypothetical protein n=1 Tax=Bacillus haynesii TaxID=1925021 RepID=UPI0022821168|nr:hypothetical protein [Bacillus haynesii]MCY8738151.1 hypothetical protein [Bacillus haynesii]MEC0709699.1 hypothetical protein [Bacillus haynesii]MEC0739467.1 hypothetical protein [Bacillus haynesii]